jgi:hypothetical protein
MDIKKAIPQICGMAHGKQLVLFDEIIPQHDLVPVRAFVINAQRSSIDVERITNIETFFNS